MKILAIGFTVIVAVQHILFLTLEMFFWTQPLGLKIFRQSLEKAEASAVLAANQGLYNGFLAAGLIWSLFHPDPLIARQLQFFFLGCVAVAGIYGAATVGKNIFFVQALPAILGLIFVFLYQPLVSV
jgi:putative membrane protein